MSNFVSNDNATSLFTKLSQSLGKRPKTWTGTRAAWDLMTTEQKAVYDGWYVNFTDDAEEGGGGAGGGHIIEDSEGTELTQRDTLKVGGSLIAEDDSTSEKTIITDGMQEIDWQDWLEMTDEEKASVPKAVITNVPGLDSKLSVQFLKKLWENPSPSAAFAAQTITLNSDDYDFLIAVNVFSSAYAARCSSTIVSKGKTIMCDISHATGGGVQEVSRWLNYVDDTHYNAVLGKTATGAGSYSETADACIPIAIYGFKASVDVDITAYMADLETDAKNVNLSDGRTVEDAINTGKTVKYAEISGTTTQSGNLVTTISATDYIVIGAFSKAAAQVVFPNVDHNVYIFNVRGRDNMTAVASTSVTLVYSYIDV